MKLDNDYEFLEFMIMSTASAKFSQTANGGG